ncbi:MAG: hypothetical protein ACRCS9_02855 [Hyphomicrobium sp.]
MTETSRDDHARAAGSDATDPNRRPDPGIDRPERRDPLRAPTTPDGDPERLPDPPTISDIDIKDPPSPDGTPTPVETPNEDR